MSDYYRITKAGVIMPMTDVVKWGRWFQNADRCIAVTQIGGSKVSTVFLGLDHGSIQGRPILFETMVFGGPKDGEQYRCCTLREAKVVHESMCESVRNAT